jgi:hypothetical protein
MELEVPLPQVLALEFERSVEALLTAHKFSGSCALQDHFILHRICREDMNVAEKSTRNLHESRLQEWTMAW